MQTLLNIPSNTSQSTAITLPAAIGLVLGLSGNAAWAQTSAAPMTNPTVDDPVRALSGAPEAKGLNFRRTRAPDGNHFCREVSGPGGNTSMALGKNLEVAPYDGAHAASADLSVQFGFGSDKLDAGDRRLLGTLAQALTDPRLEKGRFAIAGHTVQSGDEKINKELSCARAIAARAYLISAGVVGERVSAYGFGGARLLDGATPTSAANRRFEIRRDVDFTGH